MKILILNPHITAEHKLHEFLKARGIAALFPGDAGEAWQILKLHGRSVELALVHREDLSGDHSGIQLIEKVKADDDQRDLPIVLSSELWSEQECAEHQQSPLGVNAYLRFPFDEDKVLQTIEAVLGLDIKTQKVHQAKDLGNTAPLELAEHSISILLDSVPEGLPSSMPELPSELPPFDFQEPENRPIKAKKAKVEEDDFSIESDLPYLFGPKKSLLEMLQPQGDAVVPGGAAKAPDTETLKNYLLLREQDVSALSAQLKAAKEQAHIFEKQIKEERHIQSELQQLADSQKKKLDEYDKVKNREFDALQKEVQELKFQSKLKADKVKQLETQILQAQEDMEKIKERVRVDIRKIRVKEKELENKLEIVKKDSEVLISARENRIIELKRKLDILEFNLDLIQERYQREKDSNLKLQEKLDRASQALRLAEGMLSNESIEDMSIIKELPAGLEFKKVAS